MKVFVDSREQTRVESSIKYYSDLKEEYNIQSISKEVLSTGDYVFKKDNITVAFEYKRISDFMNSIKDGSLFEELTNQISNTDYDYNFLVIEGTVNKYCDNTWINSRPTRQYWKSKKQFNITTKKMYDGAIRRCLTLTPIIYTRAEEKGFQEMLLVAEKCFSTKLLGGSKRASNIRTGDIISHMLIGAEGISEKKAVKIIDDLKVVSAEDLLSKSSDDFQSVKGIGKKTSEDIIRWLHKKKED